jgi:isoleucyl-tRNA synthetase
MEDLKKRELLIRAETITHSYPFCYRCGTPLIYKSQESWFLSIEPLRQQLLETNRDINWVPKHFGEGRFAYNIQNAPDWCLSRTRYWGSPLPVWQTEDGEIFVPESVAELEKLSGQKITDLHRPAIDEVVLTLPSGKQAHRVKEVLDCWFESGAMPYAQFHYPFENKEEFEQSFPSDFIVEYTGQLRGWFYYLHVLSNILKGKPAFKNVAVTGVLAGTDGRKMSKSLGNYPDPKETMEKYGAESLRLYFMGSKIMNGEDISISEDEIREQSRLLNILHNSFKYFLTYADLHNFTPGEKHEYTLIDQWQQARLQEFTETVDKALAQFDFPTATKAIRPFIEDLSTWYIRRNRDRFVAGDLSALETLYNSLLGLAYVAAPILPFTADYIYKTLTGQESVHLAKYPEADSYDKDLIEKMEQVRSIVSNVHMIRAENSLSLRQPLAKLYLEKKSLGHLSDDQALLDIVREEVNVKEISVVETDEISADKWKVTPSAKIYLDVELTEELKLEGRYREILRKLQDARKKAGLKVGEKAVLVYQTDDREIQTIFEKYLAEIQKQVSLERLEAGEGELQEVVGEDLKISLKKP